MINAFSYTKYELQKMINPTDGVPYSTTMVTPICLYCDFWIGVFFSVRINTVCFTCIIICEIQSNNISYCSILQGYILETSINSNLQNDKPTFCQQNHTCKMISNSRKLRELKPAKWLPGKWWIGLEKTEKWSNIINHFPG